MSCSESSIIGRVVCAVPPQPLMSSVNWGDMVNDTEAPLTSAFDTGDEMPRSPLT